jgi:hypothetical protein
MCAMINNSQIYVGFLEAIRIVMRIQQDDGERLANIATDDWLRSSLYRYHLDDDSHMAANAARVKADKFLRDILPKEGAIGGTVPTGTGRRMVTPYEWANYYIDLYKDCLSNKPGTKPTDFPQINGIDISVEDLRRELSNLGYDSHAPKTLSERKRAATKEAIRSIGRQNLQGLLQKDRDAKVIKKVHDDNDGLVVRERFVQDIWRGKK